MSSEPMYSTLDTDDLSYPDDSPIPARHEHLIDRRFDVNCTDCRRLAHAPRVDVTDV